MIMGTQWIGTDLLSETIFCSNSISLFNFKKHSSCIQEDQNDHRGIEDHNDNEGNDKENYNDREKTMMKFDNSIYTLAIMVPFSSWGRRDNDNFFSYVAIMVPFSYFGFPLNGCLDWLLVTFIPVREFWIPREPPPFPFWKES